MLEEPNKHSSSMLVGEANSQLDALRAAGGVHRISHSSGASRCCWQRLLKLQATKTAAPLDPRHLDHHFDHSPLQLATWACTPSLRPRPQTPFTVHLAAPRARAAGEKNILLSHRYVNPLQVPPTVASW